MDGNLPEKDKQPISGDHPNSIFSLFAKTHRLNVSEEATRVCSRDLCEDERLDEAYGSRISSMAEDLGLVGARREHDAGGSEIEEGIEVNSQLPTPNSQNLPTYLFSGLVNDAPRGFRLQAEVDPRTRPPGGTAEGDGHDDTTTRRQVRRDRLSGWILGTES